MPIKILIAEDQRLLRQCFKDALESESDINVVATAADGREAVLAAERHKPDIILMDLAMPNLDGVSASKIIQERLGNSKTLILSLHDESLKVSGAMRMGVKGFISKDVDFEELVRIIRAVHKGEAINSPFLVDQRINEEKGIAIYKLTEREVEVLRLLVRGLNNNEIAEKLCVSEQTVKKEFVTIFNRLGVRNRTQAAVMGVQLGLLDGAAY